MKTTYQNPAFHKLKASVLALSVVALTASPSYAVLLDLTTANSSGSINGAIYQQIDPQSTGTGVIDSFVQIATGGNDTQADAYNTTVNNTLDNGATDNFNHSITLGSVPIVTINGMDYREFLLDINENNNAAGDQYVSLDTVQIFLGGSANSSVETFTGGILDHDGTLVYDMDAGGDSWVALNYALNTGSGSGDMFLYVLDSAFGGGADDDVVTLYSHFGAQGDNPAGGVPAGKYGTSDGFEEWALREPTPPNNVPDGGMSIVLLGLALTGMGFYGRLRNRN